MEKYLQGLIERMNVKEQVVSSSESISFKAYREAEKLCDPQVLGLLRKMIQAHSQKKEKTFRNAAYFIYGKLLAKFPISDYAAFFIEQLKNEDDKYVISAMLDRLCEFEIPDDVNTDIITELAYSEKWQIRYSAISALGSCNSQKARDVLEYYILQEDDKKYKYEIIYANAAFGKIGVDSDISLIETHLHSRIRDVRSSAEFAIENIKSRNV